MKVIFSRLEGKVPFQILNLLPVQQELNRFLLAEISRGIIPINSLHIHSLTSICAMKARDVPILMLVISFGARQG
jgi:hypothetical protein